MKYREAIQFLYSLRWFGAKLGLRNTLRLAQMAGNPQEKLRFIHVAGTNGKGSTCAMLESIYRAAGLRVGLFTSPHLVAFAERIQVNRELISEAEVARLVEGMQPWLKQFPQDEHPTFFEVVTVMALNYFREQQCDLVIWETGLGGRLDATNIVKPLASIITNVQYDHQEWLGETLESIAAEKAGIIKPGVPVITATDAPEALRVIEQTAHEKNAPLTVVSGKPLLGEPKKCRSQREEALEFKNLPLLGDHQKTNAAVAVASVRTLEVTIPVRKGAIQIGLTQVHWPGRLQLLTRSSGQKILLDGAHNVGGAQALAAAIRESKVQSPKSKVGRLRHQVTLILGILQDKDWSGICKILAPLAQRILLVPVRSERSARPENLVAACLRANPDAHVQPCPGLKEALANTASDPFVVIAGSLYLVGEAMELLELSATKASDEKRLNDWTEPASKSKLRDRKSVRKSYASGF